MKKSVIRIYFNNDTHYDYVNSINKQPYYEYENLQDEKGKGKIKTDLDFFNKQLKKKEGMLEFPLSEKRCLGSTNQILVDTVKNKRVFLGFRINDINRIEIFKIKSK